MRVPSAIADGTRRIWRLGLDTGMLLMLCDQCANERGLAEPALAGSGADYRPAGTVEGVLVGCFPDLYAALAGNPPDQVITL